VSREWRSTSRRVERRDFGSCLPGYQKGYSEEPIGITVPTGPDLMKDFSASNEQKGVCKRRFECAMSNPGQLRREAITSETELV
jgi:hypothetical protein